jgi:hypothetical protein
LRGGGAYGTAATPVTTRNTSSCRRTIISIVQTVVLASALVTVYVLIVN